MTKKIINTIHIKNKILNLLLFFLYNFFLDKNIMEALYYESNYNLSI